MPNTPAPITSDWSRATAATTSAAGRTSGAQTSPPSNSASEDVYKCRHCITNLQTRPFELGNSEARINVVFVIRKARMTIHTKPCVHIPHLKNSL